MNDYKNYIIWKTRCTPNLHMKVVILEPNGKDTFQVPTFYGCTYTGKDVPMQGTQYFAGTFKELEAILTGKVKGVLPPEVVSKISLATNIRTLSEYGVPFGWDVTFGDAVVE